MIVSEECRTFFSKLTKLALPLGNRSPIHTTEFKLSLETELGRAVLEVDEIKLLFVPVVSEIWRNPSSLAGYNLGPTTEIQQIP